MCSMRNHSIRQRLDPPNINNYLWILLLIVCLTLKPVTKLPDNVLFGGNRYPGQIKVQQQPIIPNLADDNGQLNSHSLDLILSNDRLWGTRRRRVRRSISSPNDEDWSPNWRGQPSNGVEMMQSFNSRMLNERIGNVNQTESKPICVPGQIMMDQAKCRHDPQKNNYYIGRCTLRTGNKLSEQIGKIWWMDSIQEWIASIPFAGHEVYCFDFSILTMKN
ncbi:hypothetical protein BLOT_015208 [Blomia tropicalis]|nr:hypothetical protein BLOT_015208 [Blomia tropicalis]